MKVVTVGSATLDIIANIADDDIERMTLHNQTTSFLLMEPGRKVDAQSVTTHVGGGAVNAAVALSRQGFDVATLVKVGADVNAEKVRERLREESISTTHIKVHEHESTAVSLLIASHDRNAAIFTHRGANGFLSIGDLDPDPFEGAGLVFISNLSNASADIFPAIAEKAKSAGAFVAANPGIRQLTRKTDPFFDSLKFTDLVISNIAEARALVPKLVERTGWTGRPHAPSQNGEPVLSIEGFQLSLSEYMARLHGLGPRYVGMTDGGKGAYLSVAGELSHVPAEPVEVIGTTGAGDAFAATLSGALARGLAAAEALSAASRNAGSVVGFTDAQSGLLTADKLLEIHD
ncbi:MAG: carbohydrate kinase family protein [Pseudomonadota bacterium]